jgi:hypothetical protein
VSTTMVERLDGNVGYIDLRRAALPQNAGASIAAAVTWSTDRAPISTTLRGRDGGNATVLERVVRAGLALRGQARVRADQP